MAIAALAMAVPAVGCGSDVAMACGHMAMAGAVAALAMLGLSGYDALAVAYLG